MNHYTRHLFKLPLSLALALAVLGMPGPGRAQEGAATQPPVVIELFSSQACTYCPPADRFLGQLIQQQGVIGLSCHVDYFDVKKGSLSKNFCTKRQTNYINALKVPAHYTPQMVVNGHYEVIGYEADKVSAAILKARAERMERLQIVKAPDDTYVFNLPQKDLQGQEVHVWLAVFDKPHSKTIQDGGNRGKNVTYYNVVNSLTDIGKWNGMAQTRKVNPFLKPQNAGFAILIQNHKSGKIIGSGAYYNR